MVGLLTRHLLHIFSFMPVVEYRDSTAEEVEVGALHRRDRYGEMWDPVRVALQAEEIAHLRDQITLSGGWAWHLMSPPHETCLKHAHDMKDIDVFVRPVDVAEATLLLQGRGFACVWTRYDRFPSAEDFRRFEKVVEVDGERPVKIVVDFFVKDLPSIEVQGGFRVVEPRVLLSLYQTIHSSSTCFAVQAAAKLLAKGIDPVGRPELVAIPKG